MQKISKHQIITGMSILFCYNTTQFFYFLSVIIMNFELKQSHINELYDLVKSSTDNPHIYFWIDVWKMILDIWVTIWNSEKSMYLWNIENSIVWFKKLEEIILNIIQWWVNENKIFFWIENTWIYGHDIMNYFDDRLPNTYILKSDITCNARKYYAKSELKSDGIDAIIISTVLRDLDDKKSLETINNPYRKNSNIYFVRRSFANERNSLRILFRRLVALRSQKAKTMVSININKERLFPELNGIFSIKHRSKSEMILINNFSRGKILRMSKEEFINEYRKLAPKRHCNTRIIEKIGEFYDKIIQRWTKDKKSELDALTWAETDTHLFDDIQFKIENYKSLSNEINNVLKKILWILNSLEIKWYYIPSFIWINKAELWLILGELWFDIYSMSSAEFMWFVWWYPETFTSGWWHMVKEPKLSSKKGIIKKFIYVWMYWFMLHNKSLKLYKKLLTLKYSINEEWKSVSNIKNKRKIEVKCWDKLLKIIHAWFKTRRSFSDEIFIKNVINPTINELKSLWFWTDVIQTEIDSVYSDCPPRIITV